MSKPYLKFNTVTFAYEGSSDYLFTDLSLQLGPGWSAVVGPNGSGKSTLLKLATHLLAPLQGNVEKGGSSVYCEQRTDDVFERAAAFMDDKTKAAQLIRSHLGIETDWHERWETLSHGERKRIQLGVSMRAEPDVLAVDEPTNHIDAQTREMVCTALRHFRGVGLLVSHDRELVDTLCHQCLFVEPPNVIVRPGGITQGLEIARIERVSLRKEQSQMKSSHRGLRQEYVRRRTTARRAGQMVSKGKLSPKDHDGREKKDRARVSGKDGVGGRRQKQLDRRLQRMEQRITDVKVKKERELGIWLPGCRSGRNVLLSVKEGALGLGSEQMLSYPELSIRPEDRIGITGRNGSGKSTLIRHLISAMDLPDEQITYVPQEITLTHSRRIIENVKDLPKDKLGHLMTIVSRLGSEPGPLLASSAPSPGEMRKLHLALGMTHKPHIVVMDEPTNHMDLPSIQCLEEALSECPCSLVLVSHDTHFLKNLITISWDLRDVSNRPGCSHLHIQHVINETNDH